jgi:hypothetical protein
MQRLYAFDMMVGNADRVRSNPNCAVDVTGLIVFDFGQCFAIAERDVLIGKTPAWKYATGGLNVLHMFREDLSSHQGIRIVAEDVLKRVSVIEWSVVLSEIPAEWVEESMRIIDTLSEVLEHRAEFVDDVEASLR